MTKLQISSESNCLVCPDKSDALEDHIRNGLPGEHVTGKHLMHNLQRDLLISDGL